MARAAADGYSVDGTDVEPEPYLGYYFRVLTKQGPNAPGGALDYMANGQMVAGHALLAFPSDYGDSGVMSFMVGEAGIVYEADLGEDTLAVASAIDSFDPGDGWSPVEAEEAAGVAEAARHRRAERLERHGLRHIVGHARRQALLAVALHGVGGQRDDRDPRLRTVQRADARRRRSARPCPASGCP